MCAYTVNIHKYDKMIITYKNTVMLVLKEKWNTITAWTIKVDESQTLIF